MFTHIESFWTDYFQGLFGSACDLSGADYVHDNWLSVSEAVAATFPQSMIESDGTSHYLLTNSPACFIPGVGESDEF